MESATTKQSIPEAKHWAGCTLNNYTDTDLVKFEVCIQPIATWYIVGKEVGESGMEPISLNGFVF